MNCGCEKNKAEKKCDDFTKAVINIENPEVLTLFHKVVIPASMGDEEAVPPAIGKYCNTLLYYEASGNSYLYSSDGIPTKVTGAKGEQGEQGEQGPEGPEGPEGPAGRDGAIQYTAGTGINIDANNVISATGSAAVAWGDINGTLADQTDLQNALNAKQGTLTAGANISIANNEISATDTTYSDFTGTDGQTAGTAGLVPAPATTDAGKFLKADGTWGTAGGGGPTVVQTTGTSQTDVMSQNATTDMVYADPATKQKVRIGDGAIATGARSVAIGYGASSSGTESVSLGYNATCNAGYSFAGGLNARCGNSYSVALGYRAVANGNYSVVIGRDADADYHTGVVSLGAGAKNTRNGEVYVGTTNTSYGFANSNYRVIGGVYDGVQAHDAATRGQLDGRVLQNASAPTTATVGTVGQLLEDTTNGKLYICTDATNPYVWEEVGAGGGSNITMTNVDPGEGSPLAADNYIGVYGGTGFNGNYSTTEASTGTTWIDGKEIYKTTYFISSLPNNTSATYNPGISNVDTTIRVEGFATRPSDNAHFPLPFAYPAAANCISLTYIKNTGLIQINTGQDRSALSAYVTIYYTKTI